MKMGKVARTIAGVSLAAAVVCGLTLARAAPAAASGDGSPSVSPVRGFRAPVGGTMAPPVDPFVDLAIRLVGQNFDGSPNIQISNLGNEEAGQFLVLQLSAPGE